MLDVFVDGVIKERDDVPEGSSEFVKLQLAGPNGRSCTFRPTLYVFKKSIMTSVLKVNGRNLTALLPTEHEHVASISIHTR